MHWHLRLRARIRWLRATLATVPGLELARRTWRELGDDHAVDLAASIAYYSILSLFPLAIGLVSLFSLVLESDSVEREAHRFFQTYLPGSHGILTANVEAVNNIRGVLGILSLLGLLWSSTLLFGAISRTVNRAWDIEYDRPFYIEKPRHFLMALSVAPLFLISVALTTVLQVLGSEDIPVLGHLSFLEHNGINALARPVPFLFTLVIFLLIYKFSPVTRTYWRFVWPGALFAAILFEGAKSIFVYYLENYAVYEAIYGTLASMIVLLAWAYVSGFIIVIGAEVSSEYYRIRMGGVRGRPISARRRRRQRKA
jgi:membrane protein